MCKYYSEKLGNITMYHADCMDVMKTFKDNQFDLAIVDPPYGLFKNNRFKGGRFEIYNKEGKADKWDIAPTEEYFKELFRVSKNQIIWGANYFGLPKTRCFIVWEKTTISENFSMAMCEYAWTSFNRNAKLFKHAPQGIKYKRFHPTQKPVALYKFLLSHYAKQGDMILDTHLGSGSIAIACYDYGYSLTGIEIDADYYDAAKKRIWVHQQQMSIDIFKTSVSVEQKKLFQ